MPGNAQYDVPNLAMRKRHKKELQNKLRWKHETGEHIRETNQ